MNAIDMVLRARQEMEVAPGDVTIGDPAGIGAAIGAGALIGGACAQIGGASVRDAIAAKFKPAPEPDPILDWNSNLTISESQLD